MNVFVDTSAFLSILDKDDINHEKAKKIWIELVTTGADLVSNNYILVETFALVQHRLGMKAVAIFVDDILPVVNIQWVDEVSHKTGVAALLAASRKALSFVDCISFETMRHHGLKTAFTFDSHFREYGFKCIP